MRTRVGWSIAQRPHGGDALGVLPRKTPQSVAPFGGKVQCAILHIAQCNVLVHIAMLGHLHPRGGLRPPGNGERGRRGRKLFQHLRGRKCIAHRPPRRRRRGMSQPSGRSPTVLGGAGPPQSKRHKSIPCLNLILLVFIPKQRFLQAFFQRLTYLHVKTFYQKSAKIQNLIRELQKFIMFLLLKVQEIFVSLVIFINRQK